MRVLTQTLKSRFFEPTIPFGPFRSSIQIRWSKKPSQTAQTRLEDRTRDSHFDKLSIHLKKLAIVLKLRSFMANRKRGHFVSVQIMSRWRNLAGISPSVAVGEFLRKYPHVFDVFPHPQRRNLCCKFSEKMLSLEQEEEMAVRESEIEAVERVKRLLMMSPKRSLRVHALRLSRRELGLPEDFRESILAKYSEDFKLVENSEVVEILYKGGVILSEVSAKVEIWREKEYREKWLSEYETRYAFPIDFPTGFRIGPGFRDKLRNWQRLPYVQPYETKESVRVRSVGGVQRYEKRAVAILHELLSLTVEKMIEVERLAHFRRDFAVEVNVREVLLKHPGIFYISTKGTQRVFLREAYSRGCLIEANPIYNVRRKILDLLLMRRRNTRQLRDSDGFVEENGNVACEEVVEGDGELQDFDGFVEEDCNVACEEVVSDGELQDFDGLVAEDDNVSCEKSC